MFDVNFVIINYLKSYLKIFCKMYKIILLEEYTTENEFEGKWILKNLLRNRD